jgi:hypothetical protein
MEDSWSFEKEFGFNPPRPLGDRVCIMRYTRKYSDTIIASNEAEERAKFESIVGRIVKIGSACFKGDKFKEWDANDLYKVGDFVTFRVNPGMWFKYGPAEMDKPEISLIHGAPPKEAKEKPVLTIIFDDAINSIVEDPAYVDRE